VPTYGAPPLSVSSWIPITSGTIHTICTACPPVVHSPHALSTRCGCRRLRGAPTVRDVSHTPTYDQLRGERINADVPPSEDSPRFDQSRKLHPADDTAGAHGQSPGPAGDLTSAWSWFESVDACLPGKHHSRDDAPGAAEVCGQSPGTQASQARLGVGESGATSAAHGTRRSDAPTAAPSGPQAALPPVAHARHTPPHGARRSPAPAGTDNRTPEETAGDRGAHPKQEYEHVSVKRTEPRYPMPKAVH
jgi:hypothetical protein